MTKEELIQRAKAYIPEWVEFMQLRNGKDADAASKAFFSDAHATAADFARVFNVDLGAYKNFYLEVALANTPDGNLYAAKVAPILVLRQSSSGKTFSAHIMKCDGLINPETGRAWIRLSEWEKHIEDNFQAEMVEKISNELDRQERAQRNLEIEGKDGEG